MKKNIILLAVFFGCITTAVAQDIITLKNGDEIKAKVQEIGSTDIKYKKYENLTGPVYTLSKAEIFMIKYENGERDVFTETPVTKVRQGTETITLREMGGVIYSDKTVHRLSSAEIRTLMVAHPEALSHYNKAKHMEIWSYVSAGIGGGLLGWGLGGMLVDVVEYDYILRWENYLFISVGSGMVAAGVVLAVMSTKNIRSAVSIYNSAVTGGMSAFNYNLRFGLTCSGGVGFTLAF